tara:strand:+ start:2185 stop:3081 length:897 start_codon:yes stop_codon:yes gene_type:complete
MKYTNKHNLPIEIIRAIKNDQYSKGESHISVTGLLQSPRIRLLNIENQDKITVDYSDEVWKILGQGIHAILERANENYEDTITEQRMFAEVNGWTISGQTDSLALDENILKDYKVTSVWTVISALSGGKKEWEEQLNCYAWLHKKTTGETIDQLNIIALARDWNKRELQRRGGDYPVSAISTIKIPVWSFKKQEQFINERVSKHQDAELIFDIGGDLPLCTDEERWKKDDTYRVMKKGRKTAVRVLASQKEADKYLKGNDDKAFYIEHSLGECMKCTGNYCGVAEFCNQYQQEEEKRC